MHDDDATAGPVVTVFRSTLRPEAVEEYEAVSERMVALARPMSGLLDYKTFGADDGERVTIVTFASTGGTRRLALTTPNTAGPNASGASASTTATSSRCAARTPEPLRAPSD